jgi:hypothetical protein
MGRKAATAVPAVAAAVAMQVRSRAIFVAVLLAACSSDDEAPPPAACVDSIDEPPDDLACTGKSDPSVRAYAPAVPFWSDGLEKDRFIALPDGAKVDATNMDSWRFPVGTRVWKEFRKGARKIETRYFRKVEDDRWLQAAYVWNEDGTKAVRGEGNDLMVDGAPYHVPRTMDCNDCHRGSKDKLLGFEAISLAQPGAQGLNLATLVNEQRIAPAPPRNDLTLPDPALGILHVNCGITCHNDTPTATANFTGLRLRLAFGDVMSKPPAQWQPFTTTIGVKASSPGWAGEVRIKAGSPEESLIPTVMKLRGEGQMPPLATKIADTNSVGAIENWIRALPH